MFAQSSASIPNCSQICWSLTNFSRLREHWVMNAPPMSLANGMEMPRRVTVAVGCGLRTVVFDMFGSIVGLFWEREVGDVLVASVYWLEISGPSHSRPP